jgi:V/A-type H+-transporting ATPase subunit D
VTGAATRSRLTAVRQERQAARLGRDLLDQKREAVLRALLDAVRRREVWRAAAHEALTRARTALAHARVEAGADAVDRAALAQPVLASVDWRPGSVVGVPTPRLDAMVAPFAAHYGATLTRASVDRAGEEFSALIGILVRLAQEEEVARNLQSGLAKTVRRLKALEQVVIPRLEREARAVAAALEEEERDDSLRRRRWNDGRAPCER